MPDAVAALRRFSRFYAERLYPLALTEAGQAEFAALTARLAPAEQARLVEALLTAEHLLGGAPPPGFTLRPHRPGDLGWVVHRHAALYAAEYGWDIGFEAMVAEIAAGFIRSFDPAREACWIAERAGATLGSVTIAQHSAEVAKLRLLYVEPAARGLGIGRALVAEALGFARARGYARVTLWTNDILVAARRIYQAAGFRLVASEAHRSFGRDLVGENWVLDFDKAIEPPAAGL
jgi:GNAT superfamily N-acetyltransferase